MRRGILTTCEMSHLARSTGSFRLPTFLPGLGVLLLTLVTILSLDTDTEGSSDPGHAVGILRVNVVGGV